MAESKKQNRQKATDAELAAKLTWLPKKTFELTFTIPWQKAKKTYDEVLKEVTAKTTIKGFRKGKAPLGLVEKNLDKAILYEEVIKSLLPETYQLAVKQHNLQPITPPRIEIISLKEGEDWQFKARACEKPEVKLGNYQQLVRGELAKSKIWTPDKGRPDEAPRANSRGIFSSFGRAKSAEAEDRHSSTVSWFDPAHHLEPAERRPWSSAKEDKKEGTKPSPDQKLRTVTKILLENLKVEISDILIENELNRILSQLLDQVNTLGMTINQYLSSRGLTSEQLRANLRKQAEETLKLELILQKIVEEQNIKVSPEEIEKMIETIPEEKTRKSLNKPQEKAYLSLVLAKRKAIDYLLSL